MRNASGPREGQKSTSFEQTFHRLTFCLQLRTTGLAVTCEEVRYAYQNSARQP